MQLSRVRKQVEEGHCDTRAAAAGTESEHGVWHGACPAIMDFCSYFK